MRRGSARWTGDRTQSSGPENVRHVVASTWPGLGRVRRSRLGSGAAGELVHDGYFAAHGAAEGLVKRHVDGAIASSNCQRLRGWQGQFYVGRAISARAVRRWPCDICESSATDYGGTDVRTGLSADAARPMHRAETTGANCPPLARSLRRPVRAVGRRPRGARVLPRHLGGPHLNLVQAGRAAYPLHFGVLNVRGDGVL